jgi:hypothetical protein
LFDNEFDPFGSGIVITEIMQNPSAVSDADGEWFELHNTSEKYVDLKDWIIRDDSIESEYHTISISVVVGPGEYILFAVNGEDSTNGGLTPDYVYSFSDISLSNSADGLVIENSVGMVIDTVVWDDGASFPDPSGASMNLDIHSLDSSDNDVGDNWCQSLNSYGDGDLGTPGTPNIHCPQTGDIVVTEIMQNPSAVSDSAGEWFEVRNNTNSEIDLENWLIQDDATLAEVHQVATSVPIEPGEYAVLAVNGNTNLNGGVVADYVYTTISLGNSDDGISLKLPSGELIDSVVWDNGSTFPDPSGASMNLDNDSLDSVSNDVGSNWCVASSAYGSGDLGTPGSVNDDCP